MNRRGKNMICKGKIPSIRTPSEQPLKETMKVYKNYKNISSMDILKG